MAPEPEEHSLADDLAEALAERLRGLPRPVVGIDGVEGAGKSHLAARLAAPLDATVVSLDTRISDYRASGLAGAALESLAGAVALARAPVIVEGVCLLRVAERLRLRVAAHVYVKRIGAEGAWYDEGVCESPLTPDALVERERAACRAIAEAEAFLLEGEGAVAVVLDLSARTEAVLRYHAEHRPSGGAHFVFNRPVG